MFQCGPLAMFPNLIEFWRAACPITMCDSSSDSAYAPSAIRCGEMVSAGLSCH